MKSIEWIIGSGRERANNIADNESEFLNKIVTRNPKLIF